MQATRKESGSGRKLLLIASMIAISLLIALAVAEIFVRLTMRYNTPETVKASSLQYVPAVFAHHRLKGNQDVQTQEGWGGMKDDGWEGFRYVINGQGYRGSEIAVPKGEDTCRVVILGGSAVFGIKASEEDNWPRLVDQYLKEEGYHNIEVINAGVPGHASFDSLGRLYSQIWTFEPDFVLVYNVWNDIKTLKLMDDDGKVTPLIFLARPFRDDANPFMNYRNAFDKLLSASQIYVKLRTRYYLWKLKPKFEGTVTESQEKATYGEHGLRQFKLDYELFVDTSRNIGATPVLLTQATLLSPDNSAEERERIGYEYQRMDHETLVRAMSDFNDVIRSVAKEKGAAYLDLDEQFSGNAELFVDHVHLTKKGRMSIARAVGRRLEQLLNETSQCKSTATSSAEVGPV